MATGRTHHEKWHVIQAMWLLESRLQIECHSLVIFVQDTGELDCLAFPEAFLLIPMEKDVTLVCFFAFDKAIKVLHAEAFYFASELSKLASRFVDFECLLLCASAF